jgi:hypothetical protein
MTGVEIASILIEGSRVVGDVVRLVIQARHFKRECVKIRDDCVLVLKLMRKEQSKMVDQTTFDRILRYFEGAKTFLQQCAEDWGWIRASIDLMFRRKHENLQKELAWVMSIFTVDLLVGLGKLHTPRDCSADG